MLNESRPQPSPIACYEVFVALADPDGHTLVPFYSQVFGQEPEISIPGVYAEYRLPGLRLGIFQPSPHHVPEFAGSSSGPMSLCLEVTHLETAIAHLTQIGYPPSGAIAIASHGRELYAYDPLGNRLILHEAKEALT